VPEVCLESTEPAISRETPATDSVLPEATRRRAALVARGSALTFVAVALATGICAQLLTVGADSRWLAALGRIVVHSGSIPNGVPFAAAPSGHWTSVPVLGELAFHALGGPKGLAIAQLVATALTLALIAVDMRATGAPDAARALVLCAVLLAAGPALVVARAQLFSLVLFAATLVLLRQEARQPSRRLWLLVPLIALWSNLHGGVLIGLAVAAAYLLFERARMDPARSLAVLAASGAALFATPAVVSTGGYYVGVFQSEAARQGVELWAPLSVHGHFDLLFVIVAVPLVILALSSGPALWELVCLVGLGAATVHIGRNSVWFALFIAAPAARGIGARCRAYPSISPRTLVACACVCAFLVITGLSRTPFSW
jgi:hypothetical protein